MPTCSRTRWEDVHAALERGQLEFLDHPYSRVFKALRMSTDALPTTDCARYFDLAVFPEDVDVPVETVCILWRYTGRLEEFEARDLLRSFACKSLLTMSGDGERVSFHDLQHDFLRLNVDSLADAQDALIEAYRSRCADGWASGPNDSYFFRFLPHHLAAAGRHDELEALLADYAWIEAKLKATNVSSVISDYDLVANEPDLSLVQGALRLSIPALSRDWTHLPSQLMGRLREVDEPRICALLKKASAGSAWLCPQIASLTPPGGPLLQTFAGHTKPVTALAVLPDGRALSGSEDDTLRLWDLESGQSRVLEGGYMGRVTALAVLPDGRALSVSEDGTLWMWDLESGQKAALEGHTKPVTALAVLPDGRALSGSEAGTLRLWDLESGQSRVLEGGYMGMVTALAVLPDGRALSASKYRLRLSVSEDGTRRLSVSEDDGTLWLWDLESGQSRVLEGGYMGMVTALAVLPDGRALSGSEAGTLRLWDLESGQSRVLERGYMGMVTALAVLPDGRALSGSEAGTLWLWDLESGQKAALEGHMGRVTALAMLPDDRALSASEDGTLRLWDLASGEGPVLTGHRVTGRVKAAVILRLRNLARGQSRVLEGHMGRVTALAVLPDGRALSASKYRLRLWDLESGQSRVLEGHMGRVTALAVLPDGRALSGSEDGTLRLWDLESGQSRVLDRLLEGHTEAVSALAVLPDGRVLDRLLEGHVGRVTALAVLPGGRALSGSEDGTLQLWDLEDGDSLVLRGHTKAVSALAVLPDGRALSGSHDGTLRLWNLARGEGRLLEGHTKAVSALAVLPDGRALSGSHDGTLRLWNLARGEGPVLTGHRVTGRVKALAVILRLWNLARGQSRVLEGHTKPVTALAVLPDGRVLSGSDDRTLRLWDLASGQSRVLEGHTGRVTALAVLPDGRALSASDDWSVILWDGAIGAPIAAFVGDTAMTCVAATPTHLIAGSANGAVHLLRLRL